MPDAKDVERTDDGRYVVVDGRRWRASDPGIPDALRQELVDELMAARRAVRAQEDDARDRVQDAKVALGERGPRWWDEPGDEDVAVRAEATIRALLRKRDGRTICPSDAARVVGGDGWRRRMDQVRGVAADLARRGELVVTQKGVAVDLDAGVKGPVRLARPEDVAG
ncbi:DUF3253 domain-containing protein [Aeromicrobium sp. IC_218]|uniref:DUF3253 domain-containing protein n=1 Tax=Aeromicrobium sp. IC_218 TaxID=2545468 RepID=UPI001F618F78|nr:DUF3253 domain-containing protein [Aeromicrobium sp. IC_218]